MIYYFKHSCKFLLEKQIINCICIGGGGSGSTSNCFMQYNQIPEEAMQTTGGGSGQILYLLNYELPYQVNQIELVIGQGGQNPILPEKIINKNNWSFNDIQNGNDGTSTVLKINNQVICEALPGFGGIYNQQGGNGYYGGGIYISQEQTTLGSEHCTIKQYNNLYLGKTIYKQIDLKNITNFGGIGNILFYRRPIAFRNNIKLSRRDYNNINQNGFIFGNGGYGSPRYSGSGSNGVIIFFDDINEL